jgi:hypothetical protein
MAIDKEFNLSNSDNAHIDRRFDEIMDELHKINGAFATNPDGTTDFAGHKQYHEAMIKAATAQEQFWNELKLEVAKKGIWSLLVIICGLVVVGVSAKFGIGGK